jgi:hypothetical protein
VPTRFSSWLEFARRLVAAGGALLVLALAIFAVSPDLHHALHDASNQAATDGCAIELFASGISVPLGTVVALPPSGAWQEFVPGWAEELRLAPPRYLRQPERGPPSLG